ncbi:MAG: hypothetical protein BMS9Abin01_1574 [Gammaproteobacteria bacterium]|nr:MAG: hypothetical protein BMS9Abin01_1574 [Gammaproteobacteria bacterium]
MSEFFRGLRASVTVKLLFIGFLVLLLLIPMGMIENVIYERNNLYLSAKQNIMNAWGREQTVGGPVLTLPYRAVTTDDKGVKRVRQSLAHFLPAGDRTEVLLTSAWPSPSFARASRLPTPSAPRHRRPW